jgi:hypothetical protein
MTGMPHASDTPGHEAAAVLVSRLRKLLGAKLVAYLGGAEGTRTVQGWAAGEGAPTEAAVARLRAADRAAAMIAGLDAPAVVQAWFQGANPLLADRTPASVLVEDPVAESGGAVLATAWAFAQRT